MRRSLVEQLVDPATKAPLELRDERCEGADVLAGELVSGPGASYPIVRGIARFTPDEEDEQEQTRRSFGFKWQRPDEFASADAREWFSHWIVEKYGFTSVAEMRSFFAEQRRILDAGCGNGLTTSLWMEPGWRDGGEAEWIGVDISEAIDVARERLGDCEGTDFVQADVLNLPFPKGSFSAVFSEGVLHHTPSTEAGIASIASVLAPGGEALFYVYRTKSPLREFADDYIRDEISSLPPEEALSALRPLTALGKALADLEVTVTVPEDVSLLGIPSGSYDVQRLLYWHFAKLFWNDSFSFDENNLINFDWYHPRYAHRQTEGAVRAWCEANALEVTHLNAQESGFTVRARKGG